jgi:Tfp pilus assembly protein PilF
MPSVIAPTEIAVCKRCREPLPVPDLGRCPACGEPRSERSERVTFVVVAVVLIAVFALTQWLVRLHRQTELSLAKNWFSRGERAMPGYPNIAAEDYRTALTYDRENDEYRLHLAQALLAANHLPEARAHLLSLWEEEPADGEVNLSLAHLYAKEGKTSEAVRYYRNAINGVWAADSREHRVATRFELAQYLLQQKDLRQAEVELIALQADAPREVDQQLRLAQLLLDIGDPARAQGVYEEVLKTDATNAEAWLGNGKSSFAMGDYPAAEREFASALQHNKQSTDAEKQLGLAREVLRIAPNLRGLSLSERSRRVSEAFDAALKRLGACAAERGYSLGAPVSASSAGTGPGTGTHGSTPAPSAQPPTASPAPSDLQLLYTNAQQKKTSATEQALRKNPDALESTMDFVFAVERATQPRCPEMSETDRALLILGSRQGTIR